MAYPFSACPRCGYHLHGSIGQGASSNTLGVNMTDKPVAIVWTQQQDATRMQRETERLNEVIHRLNQERANLLRKINSIRANTRRLPPEILSTIFELARPPIDFTSRKILTEFPEDNILRRDTYEQADDFQMVLGAVSYHWRQVVWSTPQLWTTISVEVWEPACENNEAILKLYFQNARSLPVTIELDFRAQLLSLISEEYTEERNKSLSRLECIRRTVFVDNAHRIRTLILSSLPLEWASSIGPQLSRCQGMRLLWPSTYARARDIQCDLSGLSKLPTLQHITLRHLLTPVILPATITIIRMEHLSTSQAVTLLVACPNLVEFENACRYTAFFEESSEPALDGPIVLHHLKRLKWFLCHDSWSTAFLSHIRFAQLHTLQWSFLPPEDNLTLFIAFFSDLPPTLQTLEFFDIPTNIPKAIMLSIFINIPPISQLSFIDSSSGFVLMAMSIIGRSVDRLQAGLDTIQGQDQLEAFDNAESPKVLISLDVITMSNCFVPLWHLGVVAEMLELLHRAKGSNASFRLVFSGVLSTTNSWDPEDRKRIRRLLESGFNLDVVIGTSIMDWSSEDDEAEVPNV